MPSTLGFSFSSTASNTYNGASTPVSRKRQRDSGDEHKSPSKFPRTVSLQHAESTLNTSTVPHGRALPITRRIDALSPDALRSVLKELCAVHETVANDLQDRLQTPTVAQALQVLESLENKVKMAFPYGGDMKGDYAFDRVLPSINQLLDNMLDYTLHFMRPNEALVANTLAFLAGATSLLTRLPDWHKPSHNRIKYDALQQLNSAWVVTLRETVETNPLVVMPYRDTLRALSSSCSGMLDGALREVDSLCVI